ncbi:hypothetical protein SeMB42_g07312 [Synchytrium endobioticum]|uniref:Efficient mitochondria targeting-associated protein 19 n=1 Tax=Synchytrium endobioticum TaxID=286115 RepID=A0A507CA77_9FUNG|nr:hypothetical protein SeMB42_g07312 [Synchytrium endobioticum]TPX44947.1 hypothetical protein SeLEV6574_g04189 [Synchytrium endobioticum]
MPSISGFRPLSKRPLDLLLTIFFAVHIPTSLLIDGQAVLPKWLTLDSARTALAWFVAWSGDPLMGPIGRGVIPWFDGFAWCELLFQVPFFFYLCNGLIKDDPKIREASIFYCGHVMTTLVPVLSTFAYSTTLSVSQKSILTAIYLPYFLVPLVLLYRMTIGFEKWRLPGAKHPDKTE